MSIDFDKVSCVRDNLLNALMGWRSQNDGLWRSSPDGRCAPSFTCTAMSIQALHEASELGKAQMVANSILPIMFPGGVYHPLPSEGNPAEEPHILNNSWTVFSLLECFPEKAEKIWPAVKWIMDAQDKNTGWWNQLPNANQKTSYPIFCAYALTAIIQYFDQADRVRQLDDTQRCLIMECLMRGIDALMDARTNDGKKKGLLLWPQKEEGPVSFGVSTLCAHVLSKAGRVLDKPHLSALVPKTFEEFGRGLEKTGDGVKITVLKHTVDIWNQTLTPQTNYFHSVFAPISLVTVLRYIKTNNSDAVNRFYTLIDYFTNWILDNAVDDGNGGVMGSISMRETTTWSTAAAIITLSRILSYKELIKPVEANHGNSINPPIATKIKRIFNKFADKKAFNVLAAIVVALISSSLGDGTVVQGEFPFKFFGDSRIAFSSYGFIVIFVVVYLILWFTSRRRKRLEIRYDDD